MLSAENWWTAASKTAELASCGLGYKVSHTYHRRVQKDFASSVAGAETVAETGMCVGLRVHKDIYTFVEFCQIRNSTPLSLGDEVLWPMETSHISRQTLNWGEVARFVMRT